jgi:FAS-associated factor 2
MVCIGKCHLQRSLYTRTLIHSLSSLPPSSPSLLHPPGHSRERRDTDKRLREEQDIAFQASLEADKAKKRERQQHLAEEEVREAQEREREEMEQRKEEEFAREVSLRRERLPPEPASSVDPATVVLISLRLPSGERLERRFHNSDQLQVMCT